MSTGAALPQCRYVSFRPNHVHTRPWRSVMSGCSARSISASAARAACHSVMSLPTAMLASLLMIVPLQRLITYGRLIMTSHAPLDCGTKGAPMRDGCSMALTGSAPAGDVRRDVSRGALCALRGVNGALCPFQDHAVLLRLQFRDVQLRTRCVVVVVMDVEARN